MDKNGILSALAFQNFPRQSILQVIACEMIEIWCGDLEIRLRNVAFAELIIGPAKATTPTSSVLELGHR